MDKKRNLILVFLLVLPAILLAGGLTWLIAFVIENIQENDAWREKGLYKIGQVVFAERYIEDGEVIKEEDLFEQMVDPETIRANSILCKDFLVGKTARYSLSANSLITCDDMGMSQQELEKEELKKLDKAKIDPLIGICPHDKSTKIPMVKTLFVVKTTKAIDEGAILKVADLKIEKADTGADTTEALRDIRNAVGHQLRNGASADHTLVHDDLRLDGAQPITAYVAVRDLKAAEVISEKDIQTKELNSDQYRVNELLDKSFIVGKKATQTIKRDQVIRCVDVSSK